MDKLSSHSSRVHLYEITLSYNCQNLQHCGPPFGVSAIRGWLELDGGTGATYAVDGEIEIQGHQNEPSLDGTLRSTGFEPGSVIDCVSPSNVPFCSLFLTLDQTPPDASGEYFDVPTLLTYTSGIYAGEPFPPGSPVAIAFPLLIPAPPGHYNFDIGSGIRSTATVTQLH